MSVLVDSSIWIQAQNPRNGECIHLKKLITQGELIYITEIIQVEVSQGARNEELFFKIWDSFLGFPNLKVTDDIWLKSAQNFFKCRKKGITPTTIDCLIATTAKYYDVPLWTADKGMKLLSQIVGFRNY